MLKEVLDLFLEEKIKDIVCTEDILNNLPASYSMII